MEQKVIVGTPKQATPIKCLPIQLPERLLLPDDVRVCLDRIHGDYLKLAKANTMCCETHAEQKAAITAKDEQIVKLEGACAIIKAQVTREKDAEILRLTQDRDRYRKERDQALSQNRDYEKAKRQWKTEKEELMKKNAGYKRKFGEDAYHSMLRTHDVEVGDRLIWKWHDVDDKGGVYMTSMMKILPPSDNTSLLHIECVLKGLNGAVATKHREVCPMTLEKLSCDPSRAKEQLERILEPANLAKLKAWISHPLEFPDTFRKRVTKKLALDAKRKYSMELTMGC